MKARLLFYCSITILGISCSDDRFSITGKVVYLDDWGTTDKVIQLLTSDGAEAEKVRLYIVSKDHDNTILWNSKNLSIGDTTYIKYIVSDSQKQDANYKWPNIKKHLILLR